MCVVCRGLGLDHRHVVTKCTHEVGRRAGAKVERRRRAIRFQPGRCCFKCGLPQSICNRYNEDGVFQPNILCQYYGIMMSVVFGLKYGFEGVEERWKQRLETIGVKVEEESEVGRFLGQISTFGGVDCYRLMIEFKFIVDRISEEEATREDR